MFVTESVPIITKIKEFVDWDVFSDQQKWVIYVIAEQKYSWKHVSDAWREIKQETLSQEAISTCLTRSALSRSWKKGENMGNTSYLCNADLKLLDEEIKERASICKALDTVTVTDEAAKLKTSRIKKGAEFLRLLRCSRLASELENIEISPPSRPWVNDLLNRIEAHLATAIFINQKRFLSCSYDVIDSFFYNFYALMHETITELKFTTDETMMELTKRTKVVIPDDMKVYMESATPDIPHITVMCCTNVIGIKPPLFIIIPDLKNLPDELKQQVQTGKIWVCSTTSGWMNRWSFALWSFFFIVWYVNYIDNSNGAYSNHQALLVLDGHTSRENPISLQLFKMFGIRVLVLPSHTTHVLQLFDVGIAGALKERFTREFAKNLKNKNYYIAGNDRATMRKAAVDAFVEAWDLICNKSNCVNTAAAVGLEPVDKEAPKKNPYVRNLTPEEKEIFNARVKRKQGLLDINSCEISKEEKIREIKESTIKNERDKLLCTDISQFHTMQEIFTFLSENAREKGVNILCKPPPCRGYTFQ